MESDSKTISRVEGGLEEFVGEPSTTGKSGSHDNLIQVAQADTGQTGSSQASGGLSIEQAQAGDFDPNTVTQTFAVIDGRAIVLPADTVISRILVSGTDLVVIAADGSVYLIENGAQTPPTLVIDGLTIPSTALAQAITSGTEIQPAAGPDSGSGAPESPGSSGNNFAELEIGNIGDGFGIGGLLEGLDLFFSGPGDDDDRDELPIEPVVLDDGIVPVSSVLVEEDDLVGIISFFYEGGFFERGFPERGFSEVDTPVRASRDDGPILHDIEPGFIGHIGGGLLSNLDLSFLEFYGILGNDEDGSRPDGLHVKGSFNLDFVASDIRFDPSIAGDSGLTSNGKPVIFELAKDGKVLIAYTIESMGETAGLSEGVYDIRRPIFEIDINDAVSGGAYTVWLDNNLDHLPTVQGEEILPFNFPFIAENTDTGGTETGVFQVQFQDDVPVLISDVLEEFYSAWAVLNDGDETNDDTSGFEWGFGNLDPKLIDSIGDELGFGAFESFDDFYAEAQYVLGLEHAFVFEEFLRYGNQIKMSENDQLALTDNDRGIKTSSNREYGENQDGSVTKYGLLGALFGADYGEAREIVFSASTAPVVAGVALMSLGEEISYTVSQDGTLLQAFASSDGEGEPRLVFEVELNDQVVGAFRFTLFDQIDMTELPSALIVGRFEGDGDGGFPGYLTDLEFQYDVVDSDGDSVTGTFVVTVHHDEYYYDSNMVAELRGSGDEPGLPVAAQLFVSIDDGELRGGSGEKTLTGSEGADPFVFGLDALDGLADEVLDYDLDEGDTVDLTELFDVNGGEVGDFVKYDESTGALSVDVNGTSDGAAQVVATFTNPSADIKVLFTDSSTEGDDTTII